MSQNQKPIKKIYNVILYSDYCNFFKTKFAYLSLCRSLVLVLRLIFKSHTLCHCIVFRLDNL